MLTSRQTASRVARCLSPKYQTLAVPVLVAQNIELLQHALSGITIISIPDKEPELYLTVRLNTGHLTTLQTGKHVCVHAHIHSSYVISLTIIIWNSVISEFPDFDLLTAW